MVDAMKNPRSFENYYSAETALWMDCGHLGNITLAQAGSTFVIPVEAIDLPPCDAQIVVIVDGRVHRRKVKLAYGLSKHRREAMILACDDLCPF
jgi:hypothetical protein